MKNGLLHAIWLGVTVFTVIVYVLPLPFRPTMLLLLGVLHGRFLARWF